MGLSQPGILLFERLYNLVAFLEFLRLLVMFVVAAFDDCVVSWLWHKPTHNSLLAGSVLDLCRSKRDLMLENALLRQQLIVLRRQVKRTQLTKTDRALMVLLASRLRIKQAADVEERYVYSSA